MRFSLLLKLLALGVVVAAIAGAIKFAVKDQASRSADEPGASSVDTWPDVPVNPDAQVPA